MSRSPMSISFKGASNFTITGGNFGNVRGDIYNVQIPQSFAYGRVDSPSLSSSGSRRTTSMRSSRRSETKELQSHCHTGDSRPLLLSPPPEPMVSALAVAPTTAAAASLGPSIQFPAIDFQEDEDGNDSDNSGTSGYERYFTPPPDMEGDLEGEGHRSSTIALYSSSPVAPIQPRTITSLPPPIDYSRHPRHSRNQLQTRTSLHDIGHIGRTASESTHSYHDYGLNPSPDTVPLHPRGPRTYTVPLPALDSPAPQQVHDSNTHHTQTTSGSSNYGMPHRHPGGNMTQQARYM